jgi:dihydrodipicolinate synthase/N-acetylneuraminate lyase
MAMTAPFHGVYAAMVTPFTDDGTGISEARLRAYSDFLIERGIDGLFILGTTGEWPLLSETERTSAAGIVAGQARGRVAVIAHVGAHATDVAVRLATAALESGVDAVSLVSPPFFPLDEDALFDHFTRVARAVSGLPVFLYNIPEFAGNDISARLLQRVARAADNVIGMKYSGDDLTRLREYRRAMGGSFSLFNGNDSLALPALHEGADGLVSGNASAFPELLVALHSSFRQGKLADAARRQQALDDFISARDSHCELSSFKALLGLRGIPVGDVRPPLKRVSPEARDALRRLLP